MWNLSGTYFRLTIFTLLLRTGCGSLALSARQHLTSWGRYGNTSQHRARRMTPASPVHAVRPPGHAARPHPQRHPPPTLLTPPEADPCPAAPSRPLRQRPTRPPARRPSQSPPAHPRLPRPLGPARPHRRRRDHRLRDRHQRASRRPPRKRRPDHHLRHPRRPARTAHLHLGHRPRPPPPRTPRRQRRARARPHHHRRTHQQQLGMVAHPRQRRQSRPRHPHRRRAGTPPHEPGQPTMGMRKHDAQPTPDTMTRERDHAPVDGTTPDDRPLLARCQSCRRQIRIAADPGSVWKHTAAPAAAPGATPSTEPRRLNHPHEPRAATTGRPANRNHQGPAMQPASTQPATRPPTRADQQLAALRARFPDWDFWHVPTHCGPQPAPGAPGPPQP